MGDFAQYFYPWATRTGLGIKALTPIVKQLVREDVVAEITVEGIAKACFILSKDLRQLETATDRQRHHASLISPFDNLTWGKPRVRELFEYNPSLELYVQKEKRKFGYYSMSIVFEDRIVGRLDPKMHRDEETMEIRALSLEEGFRPDGKFKEQLSRTILNFNRFHKAQECTFGNKCPEWLKAIDLGQ